MAKKPKKQTPVPSWAGAEALVDAFRKLERSALAPLSVDVIAIPGVLVVQVTDDLQREEQRIRQVISTTTSFPQKREALP